MAGPDGWTHHVEIKGTDVYHNGMAVILSGYEDPKPRMSMRVYFKQAYRGDPPHIRLVVDTGIGQFSGGLTFDESGTAPANNVQVERLRRGDLALIRDIQSVCDRMGVLFARAIHDSLRECLKQPAVQECLDRMEGRDGGAV